MLEGQHPAVGRRATGLRRRRAQVGVAQQQLGIILSIRAGFVLGRYQLQRYLGKALEQGFVAQQASPPLLREHAQQGVPTVARVHENAQTGAGKSFLQKRDLARRLGPSAAGHHIGQVTVQSQLIGKDQIVAHQRPGAGRNFYDGGPGRGQQRPQHGGFRKAHGMNLVGPYLGECGRIAINSAQAGQPPSGARRHGAAHQAQPPRPAAGPGRRQVSHRHLAPKGGPQAIQCRVAGQRVDHRLARAGPCLVGPSAGGSSGKVQQQRRARAEQPREAQRLRGLPAQALLQGTPGSFGVRKPLQLRAAAAQLHPQQAFRDQSGQLVELPVGFAPEQHVQKLRQAAVVHQQRGIHAALL